MSEENTQAKLYLDAVKALFALVETETAQGEWAKKALIDAGEIETD